MPSFGLLRQARNQYTRESQLAYMDAEACDVCPKNKEKQSKVAVKEILVTKVSPTCTIRLSNNASCSERQDNLQLDNAFSNPTCFDLFEKGPGLHLRDNLQS